MKGRSNAGRKLITEAVLRKPSPVPGADFGTFIKGEREKRKLTQKQLAERAKCTKAYISALERRVGARLDGEPMRPSPRIVDGLAFALSLPVAQVRARAGYTTQSNVAPLDDERSYGVLLYDLNQLKPRDKAEMTRLIEFVHELIRTRIKDDC